MTDKKENILLSALQLFANDGFNATSTSKVAKHAGVSEGLIFRHFENKDGLLKAILSMGESKIKDLFADIVLETEPLLVIRKAISLPFLVKEEDYDFWRLQFKLKWELKNYVSQKMDPLEMALNNAFEKLNYSEPKFESKMLLLLVDGISSALLKGDVENKSELLNFILKKYGI
ncbi:MAG: TetR/AcrR family transcriptional regulator [Bacteroidia bacterium]